MASVLVVEDDKDLVYIYHMALSHAGHQVTMARSGGEARQALAAAVPDLMFLDMNMPDETGLDVIRYVRSEERFRNLRIVVITANPLWERQISEDDIELFLVKPVSIVDMVTLAKRLTSPAARS